MNSTQSTKNSRKKNAKPLVDEIFTDMDAETEEYETDETDDSDFEPTEYTMQDIIRLAKEQQDWDIFEDVGEKLSRAGDTIQYLVTRNQEFIATLAPPCSWERLQKTYGGGRYHVKVRSNRANGFIKSATMDIQSPAGGTTMLPENVKPPTPTQNPMDMLAFVESQSEKARREARLEIQRMKEESKIDAERRENQANSMVTAMSNMFATMNAQTQAQMAAIQANASESNKTMMTLFMTMLKDSNARTEALISSQNNRPESTGPDPFELMKMIQDAQDRGEERAEKMYELIEAKSGGSRESKSFTEKLMDGVLPLVTQMATANQGVAGGVPTMQQPRGLVRPPNPQAQNRPTQTAHNRTSATSGGVVRPNNQSFSPVSLFQTAKPVKNTNIIKPTIGVKEETINVTGTKDLIKTTVIDVMRERLPLDTNAKSAADESLKRLASSGITAQTLLAQFTLKDMIDTAAQMGMPKAINAYLEGFYAHIQTKTANDVGGDTKDSKPTTTA